jgi:hypothetical protein
VDRLLWYVFAGSRGRATRVRILNAMLEVPINAHQISQVLEMDYKTIEYNLRVLSKHKFVVAATEGYGKLWEPSKNLLAAQDEFAAIAAGQKPPRKLGKPTNTKGGE